MTSSKNKIEIVTSVQRRRRWPLHEKRAIVEETYQPGMNVSFIARKYGISPSQLFHWRRHMEEGALSGLECEGSVLPEKEAKSLEKKIRELERMVGKLTICSILFLYRFLYLNLYC